MIAGAFILLCAVGYIGSLLPKTPEQIASTQTAAASLVAKTVVAQQVAAVETAAPKRPTPAPTKTITPYPDITMTATATHTFDEEKESLKELPGVKTVERIERSGTDYWAIVTTFPKFNKESFAQLIQIQATKVDLYTLRFAVRIDDGDSDPLWWIYNEKFEWSSSPNPPAWVDLGSAVIPTVETVAMLHPENCKTAVAYGMDAHQAAKEGLDRDHDGVACYGD